MHLNEHSTRNEGNNGRMKVVATTMVLLSFSCPKTVRLGGIMYNEKLLLLGLVTRSLRSQSNAPVLGYSRWAIMGCDQLLNAPRCNPNRVGDHNRNRSSINYGSLPTNIIILGGGITLEGNTWLRLIVWSVSDSTRRQYIFCFHTESVCWQFNIKGVVPVGAYGFYREGTL